METWKKTNIRCQHDKFKSVCRDCNGCAICVHGRRKTTCRECGGGSLCEHDRERTKCKECGGGSRCEHGRLNSACVDCGGGSICEHKKHRSACRDCGGSIFCEHGQRKILCKECGGSAICLHNKHKTSCKECGGSQICLHGKKKSYCKQCGGNALCKSTWCETIGMKKYNGYCLPCCIQVHPEIKVSRNYKTKENDVVERIKETFPNFTWVADKRIQDGCSKRRPDLLLDMGSHIIVVEIDENQHADYDCSCENKRLMELSQDLQHRPIVFIRFNPDDYTNQDGVLIKSCWKLNKLGVMQVMKTKEKEWEERIHILKQQIQYWTEHPTEKYIEIVELFY